MKTTFVVVCVVAIAATCAALLPEMMYGATKCHCEDGLAIIPGIAHESIVNAGSSSAPNCEGGCLAEAGVCESDVLEKPKCHRDPDDTLVCETFSTLSAVNVVVRTVSGVNTPGCTPSGPACQEWVDPNWSCSETTTKPYKSACLSQEE